MASSTDKKSTRKTRAAQKAGTTRPRPKKKQLAAAPRVDLGETAKRKWWQRTPKAERPIYPKLPNVFRITRKAYQLLSLNWKLILGIVAVYGVLNILLVRGFNGGLDVQQLRSQLSQLSHGGWGNLSSGLTIFALLVSSSNSTAASDKAGTYQAVLFIVVSLALIWTFRQLLASKESKLRIRDGFYQGMYPLVPVLLVLLVISLQLLPMLIGGILFSTVVSNGIAVTTAEVMLWLIIFLGTAVISLLLITPSILGLFIVTLPNMTPLKALRTARKLVRFRRWTVLRKLLFLPLLIFVMLAAIILPIILIAAVLAQWVFFVVAMFILPASLAYLYTLYRELLNE